MMDNKIYKLLFTLVIVFLLSFAAINWTETVTFSQKILHFIDKAIGNSKRQPAATVGATGNETTSETSTSGGTSGGNTNIPPPPPPPPPPSINQAPSVNVGSDKTVGLSDEVVFNAVVTDDGKPNPPALLGIFWSQVSGPDLVIFSSPMSASTNAIFSSGGSYVLRLTAFDGEFLVTDDVNVVVNEGSSGNSGGNTNTGSNNSPTNPNNSSTPTYEELMVRIQELQEILKNLQKSKTTITPSSSNPSINPNTPGASLNLSLGSTGPAVTALQKFLVAKKFLKMPAGSAYGTFGPATKAALAKFQSAHLIYPANGYYGLVTRKLVNQLK